MRHLWRKIYLKFGSHKRSAKGGPFPNLEWIIRLQKMAECWVSSWECDKDNKELSTMTVQEAADVLDVTCSRIHALIREGILRTEKIGSARLVSAADVKDYFNSPRLAGRPKKKATA